MSERVIEYKGEGITVLWKPSLCIHSEKCVKGLPYVFHPKDKRWIHTEEATAEELMQQIKQCPSGALGYKEELNKTNKMSEKKTIEVTIIPNGPLMCDGELLIKNIDGSSETKSKAAFCRCGASSNKPFCDGSHSKVEFKG